MSGPPLRHVLAPPQWQRIDLLSDLHLDTTDSRTWQAFERHLQQTPADAIFLLGDIAEVWVGDDAANHPGFEAELMALLRHTASRCYVAFLPGNRDFLMGLGGLRDPAPAMPYLNLLADICTLQAFGQRYVLVHGDAECLSDQAYQALRTQLRNPQWQTTFLHQDLPTRKAFARQAREHSMQAQSAKTGDNGMWDLDPARCLAILQASEAHTMIHGHTHQPQTHRLSKEGHCRWVLSDWDCSASPPRAEILTLTAEGLQRQAPA